MYLIKRINYLGSFIKCTSPIITKHTSFHSTPLLNATTIKPPPRMSLIVWIDMEMTGLNIKKDRIMELSMLITDNSMNIVAEGPNIVLNQPDSILNDMDEWCTRTHTETGLLEKCKNSQITEQQAENQIMEFLEKHIKQNESPLAGNTIYMDRMFLKVFMPKVDSYLHYRLIDVSTCKELCKRWNPKVFAKVPQKKLVHRGLEDIRESIEELKYYKQFMFLPN